MRRRLWILALVLVAVSCGGGGSAEPTNANQTPSPTSGTTPVAEGSYASVQDMMKDVESSFYLCDAPIKIYDPPLDDDALAQADCTDVVGFYIYQPSDVGANVAEIQNNAEGTSVLLVGNNWIIDCTSNQATCERIQGVTGGELIVANS